ncbi:hypothetical protein [Acetivibrio clariflavus]|uniref:hypothetical protein n=1 Tax=Acetivibrio clariflavus TaxID=288965 RepID=UPI0012FF47C1|nr:hypothetical protein [Acetivibrio clariflavus]
MKPSHGTIRKIQISRNRGRRSKTIRSKYGEMKLMFPIKDPLRSSFEGPKIVRKRQKDISGNLRDKIIAIVCKGNLQSKEIYLSNIEISMDLIVSEGMVSIFLTSYLPEIEELHKTAFIPAFYPYCFHRRLPLFCQG